MLWGLALVPIVVGSYIALRGRNHWPAFLMLLGLIVLLLAMTRPRAILLLPSRLETVMLAIDSSGSMRANDVQPSRIELAQAAAKAIVQEQPAFVKLGVVSVAGTAALVQAPTDKREDLKRAIDNLPLQRGSALGSGIVIALASMLPNAGLDIDKLINPEEAARAASNSNNAKANPAGTPKVKLEPASNTSAVIVLMSDGQSNIGARHDTNGAGCGRFRGKDIHDWIWYTRRHSASCTWCVGSCQARRSAIEAYCRDHAWRIFQGGLAHRDSKNLPVVRNAHRDAKTPTGRSHCYFADSRNGLGACCCSMVNWANRTSTLTTHLFRYRQSY